MSGKYKTYCSIANYLEDNDSEFHDLIKHSCMMRALGDKNGVALLIPEPSYRKKIADLAQSANVDDANKASEMIGALIIRGKLQKPSDWSANKDSLSNSQFPYQRVDIASTNAKEVVFKNGAKATHDPSFVDSSRKNNSVWKLTGEMPPTHDQPAAKRTDLSGKTKAIPAKLGSYDPGALQTQTERFKIAIAIENAYVAHEIERRNDHAAAYARDVYAEYTFSLVDYLHKSQGSDFLRERVYPFLSYDKLDIYLLIQPHTPDGPYLLEDFIVHDWWINKDLNVDPVAILGEIELSMGVGEGSGMLYSNREQLFAKVDAVRKQSGDIINGAPRKIADYLREIYDGLENDNSIDGIGPVYSDFLSGWWRENKGLKILQDELRFLTFVAFQQLERAPQFDNGLFIEVVNRIGDCLHADNSAERERCMQLLNRNQLKYDISPEDKVRNIRSFVYSTMLLFLPMTREEARTLKKSSVNRPEDGKLVYNVQQRIFINHERLLGSKSGAANDQLRRLLESLDADTLDPAIKEKLREKLR